MSALRLEVQIGVKRAIETSQMTKVKQLINKWNRLWKALSRLRLYWLKRMPVSFLGHSDRWNHWVPFSIRSYYPGYGFSLKRKDSSDVIGSQDELLFAYQDMKEEDQGVLYLDLFLEKGKKRSLSEYISDDDVCCHQYATEAVQSNVTLLQNAPSNSFPIRVNKNHCKPLN